MSALAGDTNRSCESLEIRNDLAELTRLAKWLHAAGSRLQLPDDVLFDVDHCAAEAVHNIIAYAYADPAAHLIRVRLTRNANRVELEIEDDGIPFNPLEYPQAPPVSRLEQVSLGGRGIRIMLGLMTGHSYRREDGRNLLTLVRAWKA